LNGVVFVLDGVLFGASDTRFLMKAMLAGAFGIFIPISWLSLQFGWDLIGVWVGFTLFMLWRLATNLTRFLGRRWYLRAGR
jgi:Na+-driven multidrug efflux pump